MAYGMTADRKNPKTSPPHVLKPEKRTCRPTGRTDAARAEKPRHTGGRRPFSSFTSKVKNALPSGRRRFTSVNRFSPVPRSSPFSVAVRPRCRTTSKQVYKYKPMVNTVNRKIYGLNVQTDRMNVLDQRIEASKTPADARQTVLVPLYSNDKKTRLRPF